MCKISVIILCGLRWTENVNQLGLQKESSKNEKSFHVIPTTVLTRLWPQNTFAYWSPTDKCDLIWQNHTASGSTCKNVRSGWKSSSSMLKTPISSYSRAPPCGLFSLWGNCCREVACCHLAEATWNHSDTYWLAERACFLMVRSIAPETAWQDILDMQLSVASEKHDLGKRCLSEIKQMVLLSLLSLLSPPAKSHEKVSL